MDPYDAVDYYKVKNAILAKYEISAEVYRQRFRDPHIPAGETPKEFYNRLKDLYYKWMRPAEKTVEEIGETLILEQFLRSLSPDVRVWVKEHNPHTGHRAAELVDSFLAARRGSRDFRYQGTNRPVEKGKSVGYGSGGGPRGYEQSRGPSSRAYPPSQRATPHTQPVATHSTPPMSRDMLVCHHCGKPGHFIRDCPNRRAKSSGMSAELRSISSPVCPGRVQVIDVTVNGKPARALLDTGSTQTLVRPHLVDQPETLTGGRLRVCCVNGDEHEYPIADICLQVQDQTYNLKAGIVRGLSHPVVLGQDVLILPDLVQATPPMSMVATRSQAKRMRADEADTQKLCEVLPFSQEEITPPERVRQRKSRQQRRREKLLGTVENMTSADQDVPPTAHQNVWDIPSNLRELQEQDESLKELFSKAAEVEGVSPEQAKALFGEYFFVKDGLLYHQPEGGSTEQLVVPGLISTASFSA
ncbi:hypothetical protein ACEWY4_017992 [Coilia grayii]|uniref:Uncharacterized protein n=1 Tax=Coilia grayii TaxID=363190 RepID=A0ABD1JIC5_9TELE